MRVQLLLIIAIAGIAWMSAAPQAQADIQLCLDSSLITVDLAQYLNQNVLPSLTANLTSELKNAGGGRDPIVSISPISLSIDTSSGDPTTNRLKIVLASVSYSARFGDNLLFSGPRIGVWTPVTVEASLGPGSTPGALVLQNIAVSVNVQPSLGGVIGNILNQLIRGITNSFGLNGKATRAITEQLQKLQINEKFLNPTIGVEQSSISVNAQITQVTLSQTQVCVKASVFTPGPST